MRQLSSENSSVKEKQCRYGATDWIVPVEYFSKKWCDKANIAIKNI